MLMLELPRYSSILEQTQARLRGYYASAAKKLEHARADSSIVVPSYSEPVVLNLPL